MNGNAHEFLLRLKALFRRRKLDREMAEELAFHEEMMRAKFERAGATETEAAMAARRQFGDTARWHERLRELWQLRRTENLARDVRFAMRVLKKSPGFTAVALLTLALGIGANTTVFSMINGLLLRPLDVPNSDRLVVLGMQQSTAPTGYGFPENFFRSLEQRHDGLSNVFASFRTNFEIQGNEGKEQFVGEYVSGEYFTALQTPPLLGRTLNEADDRRGGSPAGFGVVISESFWRSWFHSTPDVVGRKLTIGNTVFTVVGVMPKRFIGADPLTRPHLYVPLALERVLDGAHNLTDFGFHAWWMNVMGRLAPGVTVEEARARAAADTSAILHEDVPQTSWIDNHMKTHFRFAVEPGSTGFTYIRLQFSKPLVAVMYLCGGILLLACLNLASLLMARGTARERELATRLAPGATRRRLVQQLMTESLLIAVTGTAIGLAMVPLVGRALGAVLLSGQRDTFLDISVDARVFAFAALAAAVSTLLVGLLPAVQATAKGLSEQIRSGSHTIQAHERRRWLPRVLMSVEVALALMLVVGAGLLATSLVRLYTVSAGFDPKGVENIAFSMDGQPLRGDALMTVYRQLADGLRHLPGVEHVSFARMVPLTGFTWDENFIGLDRTQQDIDLNTVASDYFAAMRIPMLEGRDFDATDTKSTTKKIILNASAARLLLPGVDPLGRTVTQVDEKTKDPYEVVGVVGDAKYDSMRDPAPPAAYYAMSQDAGDDPSFNAVVRMAGPAGPLAGAARQLTRQVIPTIPAPLVTSLETTLNDSLSTERMMALLAVFFAVCALLVTAIGLYGTLSYATARRTSEIGIRMALGARRAQVVRLVCGQNALVSITGAAAGLVAALLASRALASFLYGTSVRDPWVLVGSVVALALIASAASLAPALRAARIDPMAAIRCE
jgi:predicted permease